MQWRPIEKMESQPIWILKYDMWQKDGHFVDAETEGAEKFTSCHGWYESEEDALKVLRHFPKPNSYRLEKVWKRVLKEHD